MNLEKPWRYDLRSHEDIQCPTYTAECPAAKSREVSRQQQLTSDLRFRTATVGKQDLLLSRPMKDSGFETDTPSRPRSRITTTISTASNNCPLKNLKQQPLTDYKKITQLFGRKERWSKIFLCLQYLFTNKAMWVVSKQCSCVLWGAFHTFYFSENLGKKAGAKRKFYAASQIFSDCLLYTSDAADE